MKNNEIARLKQKKYAKPEKSFILYDNGTLDITVSDFNNFNTFTHSLADFESEPFKDKYTAVYTRLVFKIICALICLTFAYMPFTPTNEALATTVFFIAILLVAANQTYHECLRRNYDMLVFRNTKTDEYIEFYDNVPKGKDFSEFIEKLKSAINVAQVS